MFAALVLAAQACQEAASGGKKKTIFLDKAKQVKLELVWIPPGEFVMGSDEYYEKPPHEVKISKGFWMGATKVTQEQWMAVIGSNPSKFQEDPRLPVEMVSWEDCQAFLKKASAVCGVTLELPTEAEWEYACRAGSTGKWSFGDDESNLGEHAWYGANSGSKTHPVGEKKPNAWGLYDMHGNVWEWCKDYYGAFPGGAVVDPQGASSGSLRVLRGGSLGSFPGDTRSAFRSWEVPASRQLLNGLRVAASR